MRLAVLASVISLLFGLAACSSPPSGGTGEDASVSPPTSSPHWNDKAVLSERVASDKVGGFTEDDTHAYRLGIQHIINTHGRIGAFTIRQVVDQEKARESAQAQAQAALRAAAYERQQREQEEQERQHEARLAAIAADQPTGDPDCLKLKSWKNTTGESDGVGGVHIHGTVLNTCDQGFSYVQIVFTILDSSGSNVGTAMANNTDLAAGDTWTFNAIGMYDGDSWRFRFAELDGR